MAETVLNQDSLPQEPTEETPLTKSSTKKRTVRNTLAFVGEMSMGPVATILSCPAPSATFGATVFSMSKQMLGSGVLSMADAFNAGSVAPSLVSFLGVITISGGTMLAVADLCDKTGATSYKELWELTVGGRSAMLVDLCVFTNAIFACISYTLLIGKWLTQSLSHMVGSFFASQKFNTCLIAFPLMVLALQRDLNAFRYSSMLGIFATFFGLGFVVWQTCLHWSDDDIESRACGHIAAGYCTSQEVLQGHMWEPSFKLIGTINMCASMLMMHYNIPKFHSEYGKKNQLSIRTAIMVSCAVAGCFAVVLGICGLLRFGTAMERGNILKHFEGQFSETGRNGHHIMTEGEKTATLTTWLIMVFNILASFPLLFLPMRTSFLQLCRESCFPALPQLERLHPATYFGITLSLVVFLLTLGFLAPDLTIVTKFKGAICGQSISFILPALMLWSSSEVPRSRLLVIAVAVVLSLGVGLMAVGIHAGIAELQR